MFRTSLYLFLVLTMLPRWTNAVRDTPYMQDVSHRSVFKGVPVVGDWASLPFFLKSKDDLVYIESHHCFVALSEGTLYSSSRNANYSKIELESPFNAWQEMHTLDDSPLMLSPSVKEGVSFYVVTDSNVVAIELGVALSKNGCGDVKSETELLETPVSWGEVTATTSSNSAFWISSTKLGLSQLSLNIPASYSMQHMSVDDGTIGSLLWVEQWQKLFVGTPVALYTMLYTSSSYLPKKTSHEWIGAIIDTVPVSMVYDVQSDALWIAESQSVHKQTADGRLWRIGQKQGSPITNITSIGVVNHVVWVGCDFGAARVSTTVSPVQKNEVSVSETVDSTDKNTDPWEWIYYVGNRYFPDDAIKSVVPCSNCGAAESSVMFVSATGLTYMDSSLWSLKDKASAMGSFQLPRHDRLGLVTTPKLTVYGDLTTYYPVCSDNDGLWTSMHAMGECYRYMTTKEEQAREWAWSAFEALEMLAIVPGRLVYRYVL